MAPGVSHTGQWLKTIPANPATTMREVWLQGYDEVVFDRTLSQAYAGTCHWLMRTSDK